MSLLQRLKLVPIAKTKWIMIFDSKVKCKKFYDSECLIQTIQIENQVSYLGIVLDFNISFCNYADFRYKKQLKTRSIKR